MVKNQRYWNVKTVTCSYKKYELNAKCKFWEIIIEVHLSKTYLRV